MKEFALPFHRAQGKSLIRVWPLPFSFIFTRNSILEVVMFRFLSLDQVGPATGQVSIVAHPSGCTREFWGWSPSQPLRWRAKKRKDKEGKKCRAPRVSLPGWGWATCGPKKRSQKDFENGCLQLFLYRELCLLSVWDCWTCPSFVSSTWAVAVGLVQLHQVLELVMLVLAQRKSSEDFQPPWPIDCHR